MALTQEQVDWWFSQNPDATADEVAAAVKSVGGLEGNEGLAGMIANRYAISEPEVTNYYNAYTAPTSTGTQASTGTGTNVPTFTDTILNTPTTETDLLKAIGDGPPTTDTTRTIYEPKIVDLGNGTFQTPGGNIIDSNGYPVTTTAATTADTTGATTAATAGNWPSIIYGTTGTDGEVLTRTTTSDGTPFYLHDTDEGGYYQNPNTVESYAPFTGADGKKYYNVYAPVFSSGKEWNQTPITGVLTEAQYNALRGGTSAIGNLVNSPVGSFALNLLGPWGQIINAANAANNGNIPGALLSGLNAAGGFGVTNIGGIDINTAQNVIRGLNAVDQKDWAGALTAGANLFGGVPGEYKTATNLASAGLAIKNNDAAGFATALGELTGSKDANVAAAAIRLQTAVNAGTTNPAALQAAFNQFTTAINKASTATTTGTTTADAGTDITLPTGTQLASVGNGFDVGTVSGAPIFAESKNAGTVTAPFGYSLLSSSETDDKPAGSYYDPTANAWFKPSTDVTDLTGDSTIQADAALFNNSLGTLDQLDTTRSADEFADFLASIGITTATQLTDSGLSNQDILDLINATDTTGTSTVTGGTGNDKVDDKGTVNIAGTKESCPIGTTLNPETGDCDPIIATPCAKGYHDDGTGLCVPDDDTTVTTECPTGMVRDLTTGECVWPTEECAPGFHDDGTGLCVADDDPKKLDCPEGYEPNEEGTACIETTTIIGKRDPCPPGTKYDEDLDACMPIAKEPCAAGFHDDGSGLCVPDDEPCADGYHKDESGACVPDECPEGYVRDMTTGQCVLAEEPCKAGYHRNAEGVCVPDEAEPCKAGYHRNAEGVCVPDEEEPCAEGYHRNESGLCVPDEEEPCDEGYHRENGVCVPNDCPDGYLRNLETGKCEKIEDKGCPPGQVRNAEGKCVPIIKGGGGCQPGYENVNGVCVPVCQPGYQRVNGVCKKITTDTTTTIPTSAMGAEGEKIDPIYAGAMGDFDLFATLEELLSENTSAKDTKKDSKKSKEKTKMASGGYLDDLLAEQMTVDDLLRLLR